MFLISHLLCIYLISPIFQFILIAVLTGSIQHYTNAFGMNPNPVGINPSELSIIHNAISTTSIISV